MAASIALILHLGKSHPAFSHSENNAMTYKVLKLHLTYHKGLLDTPATYSSQKGLPGFVCPNAQNLHLV